MRMHVLSATLCAAASLGFGQISTATLAGVVVDAQEGVVGSAMVTLRDPGRGLERRTTTSASGGFLFAQLAPSTYEVLVERGGFDTAKLTGIALNADDQRSVRVRLNVAARGEAVVITGEASSGAGIAVGGDIGGPEVY